MLNLKLFTNRVYAGASVLAFIFGAAIYDSTFVIPLFAQTIQSYTPTRSGLLLMQAGLILALVFPIAARPTDKTPATLTAASASSCPGTMPQRRTCEQNTSYATPRESGKNRSTALLPI